MKWLLFVLFALLGTVPAKAQGTLSGVVRDSATHEPLARANVMLLRDGKPLRFVRSGDDGRFALRLDAPRRGDSVSVSFLGYRMQKYAIPSDCKLFANLVAEAFALKEVQIKGSRTFGVADTISYDISRFADRRDVTLKDVLKKLPGIDVADNGAISFNGKQICRFTVEGLDLTGGRYGKVNESLKATDVARAEVIVHDQPVKALQGKVMTDDVAMNIKLKPEVRDKWMFSAAPVLLVGIPLEESRVGGKAGAMQMGRLRQGLYVAEYDRTGKDLARADMRLASGNDMSGDGLVEAPEWFAMPQLQAPIEAERLRFNASHNWSAGTVTKTEGGGEQRLTANYLHTSERQSTASSSSYFLDGDKPVTTDETADFIMRNDRARVDFTRTLNTAEAYGREKLEAEVSLADGSSVLANTGKDAMSQRVKRGNIVVRNDFTRMHVRDSHTLTLRSAVSLSHSPAKLVVDSLAERLNTTLFRTDNYAAYMRDRRLLTQSYKAGFRVDRLSVGGNHLRAALYVHPYWELRTGRATWRMNMPMEWELFDSPTKSYPCFSPSLAFNRKKGNRAEIYVRAGYRQETEDWEETVLPGYRRDYRTWMECDGTVPRSRSLTANARYSYKRPVRELFWTVDVGWQRTWRNVLTDMRIVDGNYLYARTACDNAATVFNVRNSFSKGFFSLHLKARVDMEYRSLRGRQLSSGVVTGYRNDVYTLSPQVSFAPSWGAISYEGTFNVARTTAGMTDMRPLMDWNQKLSLAYSVGIFDVTCSVVHHHNELQSSPTMNLVLADAGVALRLKKLRISAELRNAFNKREYVVTGYSGVSVLTNGYKLRGREVVVTLSVG